MSRPLPDDISEEEYLGMAHMGLLEVAGQLSPKISSPRVCSACIYGQTLSERCGFCTVSERQHWEFCASIAVQNVRIVGGDES